MGAYLKNLLHTVLFILTVAISPIFLILTTLLLTYRTIVDKLLSIKYKEKYGGLLRGDSIFVIKENSRSIITVLMMIDFEKKDSTYVFDSIRQRFYEQYYENPNVFPRLHYVRADAYGYGFYIKDEPRADDCIKQSEFQVDVDQKEFLDEDDIQKFVSSYCNVGLPKNDTAVWEVLVGTRPVRWRGKDGRYPVLVRVHHCIADGITIISSLFNNFRDNIVSDQQTPSQLQKTAVSLSEISTFAKVWSVINAIFHAPGEMIMEGMEPNDKSILQAPQDLSGEKITVWSMTNEEDKIVSLIKQIKKKFNGSSFTGIILSGLSTSLSNYFQSKRCEDIPATLKACLMVKFKIDTLCNDTNVSKSIKMENTFSFVVTTIPTNIICSTKPMISRLKKVQTGMKILHNSPKAQINYWILQYITAILPIPILETFAASGKMCSLVVSNMPGPTLSKFNGHSIENAIFWGHHRNPLGFNMSILTYGDNLQLGLIVDKSVISSTTECQRILDDVLKNIRQLGEEIDQL